MDGRRRNALSIAMSIIKQDLSVPEMRSGAGSTDDSASEWLKTLTSPLFLLPFLVVGLITSILGEFVIDSYLLKMFGRGLIIAVMGLIIVNNIVETYRNRQDPE